MLNAIHTEENFDRSATAWFPADKEGCATCRFWLPDQGTVNAATAELNFGFCRRRPPVIVNALAQMSARTPTVGSQHDMEELFGPADTFNSSLFPGAYYTGWCGEFEWLPSLKNKEVE